MNRQLVVQRIANNSDSAIEMAEKYYTILGIVNKIHLTPSQIKLLAFTAIRGTVSGREAKEEFERLSGSPIASIGNMIHKLVRKGLLVKTDGRILVHPQIRLNFNDVLVLHLTLRNG